ncbi:TPA: ASCH domain-containing protein [Serratia marcescens]|nr:ASCH domain-containing protein [Serratia marcescens]
MKERPVIFNGEMVRAIIDGRKTQTRRVMKPQPEPCYRGGHWWPSNAFKTMLHIEEQMQNGQGGWKGLAGDACPFGQIGDRLWVRETFMDLTGTGIEATTGKFEGFAYRADTPAGSYGDEVRKDYGLKWTPSLHMPRKACRILLEITAVRVERLNDISQEDAQAEGMELTGWIPSYSNPDNAGFDETFTPYDNFAMLWESIYGAESWIANPWVWVIEFRRVGDSAREVKREA